ncbi:MAG: DUF4157 domain-containing protein [Xanthomonadaceae bacterium]|nr:DUF4157 domain-containing protein [Xanthomonadaceae bacterium]
MRSAESAHASASGIKAASAPASKSASAVIELPLGTAGMAQQLGNLGMQRLLSAMSRPLPRSGDATPAPLPIGARDDALEGEAERVSRGVLAAPPATALAATTPPPRHGAATPSRAPVALAPDSVHATLARPGRTLDAALRVDMEDRLGGDFAQVRVHDDALAWRSAAQVQARAYTVGDHIAFARTRFAPGSARGRELLAHELVHVLQQRDSGAAPVLQRDFDDEADAAAEEAPGAPESLSDALYQRAVREAAEQVAHSMSRALPIAIPESVLAALLAAEVSFLDRSYQRLVERGDGMRILGRTAELLNPLTAVEFAARYLWGVLKGLVSPITGLISLAVGGIQLQIAAVQWLNGLPQRAPELLAEAVAIQQELQRFSDTASATLSTLREREHLLEFAGALFTAAAGASEAFEHQLVRAAQRQGRVAADSVVDHFLTTPLPELAETVGEIVGVVVIELVLLLFTDGIGNLITKVGEFARALRPLSRGAAAFVDVAIAVGRVITQIEHIIGVLLSRTVLRPLMPIFEALEPLLGRMRGFAQRLVGMSEESTLALARAGTGVIEEGAAVTTRTAERTAAPEVLPRATTPRRTATPPTEPVAAATVEPPVARISEPPATPPGSPPPAPPVVDVPRPPVRGATAEGVGDEFHYEFHPETPPPATSVRRGGGTAGEVPAPDASAAPRPPRRATSASDVEPPPPRDVRSEIAADQRETSGGTAIVEGESERAIGDPSELGATVERPGELADLPRAQRLHPLAASPESLEVARAAGVPDEVLHSGTVMTRSDFADVVPEGVIPTRRPAPDLPPVADELRRGVAGRRPTTAPDPSDVQHTELAGDIDLTRRSIEDAGGSVTEVAINRRQRAGPGGAAEAASRATRPDVQLAVVDAELHGRRILIEYDRAPGSRAMAHAREILMRDPDAIVIIKIVGFE